MDTPEATVVANLSVPLGVVSPVMNAGASVPVSMAANTDGEYAVTSVGLEVGATAGLTKFGAGADLTATNVERCTGDRCEN